MSSLEVEKRQLGVEYQVQQIRRHIRLEGVVADGAGADNQGFFSRFQAGCRPVEILSRNARGPDNGFFIEG